MTVAEIDAGQDVAVETEGVPVVNDEVVEIWLQTGGGPALCHLPSIRFTGETQTSDAQSTRCRNCIHQNVTVARQGRLSDGGAATVPSLFPQQRAICR